MSRSAASPKSRTGAAALMQDSSLIVLTTALMSAAGGLFWVVAARLQTPEAVGVAGTLVSALVVLSISAQLGMKDTLIRSLPESDDPGGDVLTAAVTTGVIGTVLGLLYVLVVPFFSAELAILHQRPDHAVLFALLAGGTAANVTTDAAFLALRKVGWNLLINGVLMSLPKLALPFLLVTWADFGLVTSVGIASVIAAVTSLAVLLRATGRPRRWGPSAALRRSVRFALASYVASLCDLAPVMLVPILVLNAVGSAQAGVYFVGFQILLLLNAGTYAVGGSMFAHGAREPHRQPEIVRHGGVILVGAVALGAGLLALLAPWLLAVFGERYAADGTASLRLLALGALGVAIGYWALIRMRLARALRRIMIAPAITNTLVLGLIALLAPWGITWVALAWAVGQLIGGVIACVLAGPMPAAPAEASTSDRAPTRQTVGAAPR